MGMLRVLSRRGDDCVAWDPQRVAVGDPKALLAIREAERIFAEQRARSATAFRVERGQAPVRIDQFDPAAQHIVLIPRIVGGQAV
jgi:hypothetical protein